MAYTTEAEVTRLFSSLGVENRVDDLTDAGDLEDLWEDITEDATSMINQYCENFYTSLDLNGSRWVRIRATYIACHILSYRRGNPSLFRDRYEQILEELEKVSIGSLLIPSLPTRSDFTPAMTNVAVNDKYYIDKIRVHSTISTGGSSGRQSVQPYTPDYQI